MAKNKIPVLPNLEPLIAAGINPKTGLPYRFKEGRNENLGNDILKALRIVDLQDATRRFKWYNLPDDIDGELIERMLYYKGTLGFFYVPEIDKFYILPYTLQAVDSIGIDVYGRYNEVKFLPFAGANDLKDETMSSDMKKKILFLDSVGTRTVQKGILTEETTEEIMNSRCVLLYDYVKQLSQTILPRAIVNEPIIQLESKMMPYMRTALLIATGISGVRVPDADAYQEVGEASDAMIDAAEKGNPWIPIEGAGLDFQELAPGAVAKAEEYMLAMQSIDNFRLGLFGLENGGLFEKKAHELAIESATNRGNVGLVMQDGLSIRQAFCDIVNSIWGLGIWVEPSETVTGDMNQDGVAYDNDNVNGVDNGVDNGGMSDDNE